MTTAPKSRWLLGEWLIEHDIIQTGRAAEIGTMNGWFASDLLNQSSIEKLYCIDCWRWVEFWQDNINAHKNEQADRMRKCFERLYQYGKRAVMIREMSEDAAWLFQDGSLDICYIDANHSEAECYNDICLWAPKVRSGGILAGHDYVDGWRETNQCEFGVKTAVDRWAKENNYEIMVSDCDDSPHEPSWFLQVR